jgi:hypothetical protein
MTANRDAATSSERKRYWFDHLIQGTTAIANATKTGMK